MYVSLPAPPRNTMASAVIMAKNCKDPTPKKAILYLGNMGLIRERDRDSFLVMVKLLYSLEFIKHID